MKKDIDIFGIAFKDFLEGNVNGIINIETDISGLEELPVMYFFRGAEELPEWEKIAMDMCKGRVLDVGAGAGSHSLILQDKGLDVTAIDISPGVVEIIKQRGVENALCKDFFQFHDDEKFDTLLFLMNGIGLAGKLSGIKNTLLHCKELMKPGAQIILESSDLIYMFENDDGSITIDLAEKYYGEVQYILSYKNIKGNPFNWLFVDYDNLAAIAEQCGLKHELIFKGDNYNYLAIIKL